MFNLSNILFYIAWVIGCDKSNYGNKLHQLMVLLYINMGGERLAKKLRGRMWHSFFLELT